jgi:hypothetical protein
MVNRRHVPLLRSAACLFLFAGIAVTTPSPAWGAAGDPIVSNNYKLDVTRTVATGSTRKIALGGAYTGIGEGNAALQDNPAAVAYRPRAFMDPWEFDMVIGALATGEDDTDNSGSTSLIYADPVLMDVGVMAQYRNFGIGYLAQMSVITSDSLPQNQEAQFLAGSLALGYTTDNRELTLGISLDRVGARVHPEDSYDPRSFRLTGPGYSLGALWHPRRGPWRFGAAYHSGVSSSESLPPSSTPITVGNLIVPNGVLVTNSLSVGTAHEWNDFPWWRGRAALASFDLKVFGTSPDDANGTSTFLTQTANPVGQRIVTTLHGGLEIEAVPKGLRLRAGTYYEPSRYDGISARPHLTGGFEVRLFKFNLWGERHLSFSYAIDAAARYQVQSLSIWLWSFTVPVPPNVS